MEYNIQIQCRRGVKSIITDVIKQYVILFIVAKFVIHSHIKRVYYQIYIRLTEVLHMTRGNYMVL